MRLLELCRALRISEFHHVSTAFVCGDRAGPVREDELECGQGFHNDYERSKFEAERRVRVARGLHATVYRPSVIVGDSRTGYTASYHGLYPFLELGDRVAEPAGAAGPRRLLALRLPFTGDEPRDLVTVDWVARAVVRLLHMPRWHGRTFHLTATRPVRMDEIKRAAEEELDLAQWVGGAVPDDPTTLERVFYYRFRDYWPYLDGDPAFDRRNTRAALPSLPSPRIDRVLLGRLIRFARADRWGRRTAPPRRPCPLVGRGKAEQADLDCADYVERFLPAATRRGAGSGGALGEHKPEGRRGLPRRRAAGPIAGPKRCRLRRRSRRGASGRRKEGRQQEAPRRGAPPRRHQATPGRRDATTQRRQGDRGG